MHKADKFLTLFYTVITPSLNPLIYTQEYRCQRGIKMAFYKNPTEKYPTYKANVTNMKGENNSNTIIVGDFNTPTHTCG